jgi:hypothetical protein
VEHNHSITLPLSRVGHASVDPHDRTVQTILDTALLADHIAAAFYYAGLTTPAIIGDRRLAGGSHDPNRPALPPGGNPSHVHYLQAALDAEVKHADILVGAGARGGATSAYLPTTALRRLGDSLESSSFLGVMNTLQTILVGIYNIASFELLQRRQVDLAIVTAGMAGVQAEHRMLGRVISELMPANNLTLEAQPFNAIDEARAALQPYLIGPGGNGSAYKLKVPTRQEAAHIVGTYGTHRVQSYV